ncbi:apolipoprotein D-like [Oratosquilla oratoria]|uniref:apolipoprotein D-like n=1 Tax=Oratosquilla oratoria TaxID=337810 RepID=UPI003F7617F7
MQPKLLLLLVISASLGYTAGHQIGFGPCPTNIQLADKLDLTKFAGKWNVIMVTKAHSKCLTMTFTESEDGSLDITEAREFEPFEAVNLEHISKYTGKLTIPNSNEPAKMNIKWPGHFAVSNFFIVDTDLGSKDYAVLFECQQLFIFTRTSAAIIARGKVLDPDTMVMLMEKLESLKIDTRGMTLIDHEQCLADGEGVFNTNIDTDTIGI